MDFSPGIATTTSVYLSRFSFDRGPGTIKIRKRVYTSCALRKSAQVLANTHNKFEENILSTKTLTTFAAAVAASFLFSGLASAGSLGLKMADKMANACLAMAVEKGWKMNVAVMDSGADLVVFKRMDGAFLGSVDIAIGKARTSANFPFPTRFVAELAHGKDGAPGQVPGIANFPGIVSFAGGLPVMNAAGEQIGSIGVSGASSGDDELCAQAGIDAVADMLM